MDFNKITQTEIFVLDMDGTIYLGDRPFPQAIEFIKTARSKSKKVMFFTNNASKNPNDYVIKLNRLGFEAQRNDIVTSGDVTINYLKKHHKNQPVYLVGTPELEDSFKENGITLSENADIVVSSFDLTLTYNKLSTACTLIRNGAKFYSTHEDYNCPTEDGFIPDSDAICALITASTEVQPRYFGKPHKETVEYLEDLTKQPRSKMAIVGDRLYTDIALGKLNGMTSILVLTGESKREDVTKDNQPDTIMENIGDLINFL